MLEQDAILDRDVVETVAMTDYAYPLEFEFKITSLANDFTARDGKGNTIAYVRQKMFKFKEAISVFSSENRERVLYKINADRWIDFNASYMFTRGEGSEIFGRVGRKGAKSLFNAHYEIFDGEGEQEFLIKEENPWAKFWDALLGEVPVLSLFTGYLFNPRYIVKRADGTEVVRLSKEASFFGRRFKLEKLSENLNADEGERMLLSLMMMSLLERRRG